MRRRDFMTLVSGAAAWPLAGHAQNAPRRIGVLVPLPESDPVFRRNMDAFMAVMKGAGWIEGQLDIRTVSIIGSGKSPADAAADILALSPDAIIAVTPLAAEALHRQTNAVPVVFVVGWFDPVQRGFVTEVKQPGGNMTGITDLEPSLGGKWLQLLKQIVPETVRAGIVYNPDEGTISAQFLKTIKESANGIAISLVELPIRDEADIERAIATFASEPNGGLIFPSDIFTAAHRLRIIKTTNAYRVPTVFPYRYYAVDGALAAYSPDQPSEFGQAAYFIDRILHGEKPGILPIQTPNKYELVINLTTAKTLGLTIPTQMLSIADELIN